MKPLILSILTAGVPSRLQQIALLSSEINKQIVGGDFSVEHLILIDNKKRSVGEKRDALLRAARGKYVAYVDDDDWITSDYVQSIMDASKDNPDVITFNQDATHNDQHAIVEFRIGNPNEPWVNGATRIKRNAWHICAWRHSIAILSHFPATNYGEDWAFAAPLCNIKGLKEIHIPMVLHYYRHSETTTEAPPPKPLTHT